MEPNIDEQETGQNIFPAGKFGAVISILILLGLYLSTFYNYLLFHTLVEMFSIVVACGIFMVAWNVRRILDNNYLLFLGIAFLFIAFLDLIHTLAYKGMPIFQGYGADLPTQLWIAARYMESLSLLIAPLFLHRRLKPSIVFSAYTALCVLLLVSLFKWHVFPHCFVEGVGLTPFKKISEVVISMILLGSLAVLFKNRKAFDPNVLRLLVASIVITIVSELAFTFYISVYGLSNLFGHFCKLISFYLIYKAVIETGLAKPYGLLFRNLKQSEVSVKESEEKYRTIVEQSLEGIVMVRDQPPKFIFANATFAKIFGYTSREIMALSPQEIYEMVHPDDQEMFFRRFSDRLDGKKPPSRYEFRGITKDKRTVWLEISSSLIAYQGKPAVLALFSDITGRKQAEEARGRSEEKYRNLFESVSDALFFIDNVGTILEANHAAIELFGYSREELLTMKLADLSTEPEKAREGVEKGLRLVPLRFYRGKDGVAFPVEITAGNFFWKEKEFRIAAIRDITWRRKAEEERAKLEIQLQQSRKMEAVGTLAGGIAHDFNNILTIILGNVELASDMVPDSNPASEPLKEIHKASIRATDMVRQLLAFSRKTNEESKPLDMVSIVRESMKMLRSAIPTSIEFKQHISDDPCTVTGDATQINQILMNLVINAADAMSEEGGLLEVILEKIILQEEKPCFDWVLAQGAYVRLKVRDTGEGMALEIMARIFDPYFTTKEVGKGTGMGLSVIHGIVKRHGGGIRVESKLGEGTVFEIYFPALEKTAVEEKEPEGKIRVGSERVLFVDDEESIVNLNRRRLERLGYDVRSTTKPVEALEWFKTDPDQFDVVITDMTMPRMTGDRLAAEVLKIRPHMPVIICTGYSERMSAKKAEALGVRKYIEKPIDLRNLASSIREVLDEKVHGDAHKKIRKYLGGGCMAPTD